jgi:hypothetical protein
MNIREVRSSTPTRELAVMVRARSLVIAIPTRWVARLTLATEVKTIKTGLPALVDVEGTTHAAWDLGAMIYRAPIDGAWVLLRVPHEGKTLRLALRTGPCLVVAPVPPLAEIPRSILLRRRGAFAGAFAGGHGLDEAGGAPYGLALDPTGLWTPEELTASARVLEAGSGP